MLSSQGSFQQTERLFMAFETCLLSKPHRSQAVEQRTLECSLLPWQNEVFNFAADNAV